MSGPDWLHYPPLPALRAFEATARLGGFSAAARALNVTHAAVAQQVRALEAYLDLPLVHRAGRTLAVTHEGEMLASALTEGFEGIQATVDTLRAGGQDRPVMITATPVFSTNWIMPRLGQFWSRYPDVAVSLRPDARILDLRRERIDFGIRFGRGDWPGVESTLLTSARYVVVGAPQLFNGRNEPITRGMAKLPWILASEWPEQKKWIDCCIGLDMSQLKVTEFTTEELALSAARQGYGLYVASKALVEADLDAGNLVVAFDSEDESPGYYIVTPPGPLRKPARTFMRWLLETVR